MYIPSQVRVNKLITSSPPILLNLPPSLSWAFEPSHFRCLFVAPPQLSALSPFALVNALLWDLFLLPFFVVINVLFTRYALVAVSGERLIFPQFSYSRPMIMFFSLFFPLSHVTVHASHAAAPRVLRGKPQARLLLCQFPPFGITTLIGFMLRSRIFLSPLLFREKRTGPVPKIFLFLSLPL